MAFAPIALTIPQYDKITLANWWLKAYDQGTTTPLSMATDSTGGTLLVKAELDSEGFPITAGSARFIPFINGDYDLWLFPTAAEADANDTTNAIQFADNLNADPLSTANVASYTVADKAAAVLLTPVSGKSLAVESSDGGFFTAAVGAAPGTYSDDGGIFCGTVFIPTGGDGSIAWTRVYNGGVNVLWFGAHNDGTNQVATTTALGLADYLQEGSYLVDDDLDVSHLFGEGTIVKSWGSFPVSRIENGFDAILASEVRIGATDLNPRGFHTDGKSAYVITQGSYASSTQARFHIFDIQNPHDITLISTIDLGSSGTTHRALSVNGKYAYAQSTGGVCQIIDISDKTTPVVVATPTFNAGNREYSATVGGTLIIPKQTGDEIDFYSLRDPESPVLISTLPVTTAGAIVLHEAIFDGSLMWVMGSSDGQAGNNNLFCIDISDINNPVELSASLLPDLLSNRRGLIKGKYLYTGGFAESSRLTIVDISDPTTPVVVYTHATELGSYLELAGDYLIAVSSVTNIYDIRQPDAPELVASNVATIGARPHTIGSYVLSYGAGDGAQGPSGIDGLYNPSLQMASISKLVLPGLTTSAIEAKELSTDELNVRNRAIVGTGLDVGPAGIKTEGEVKGKRAAFDGIISNTERTSVNQIVVAGDISSATTVLNIHQLSITQHLSIRVKYFLIYDRSTIATARHSIGEKYGSIAISGGGGVTVRLSMDDMITHRDSGTAATLAVSFVNGTGMGGDPMQLQITSAALNIANSRAVIGVSIEGEGGHRAELA